MSTRAAGNKKYEWNAICDRCAFEYKNWQLKKEWTGLMVCDGPGTNNCWEARHPQDFLRARKESNKLPWTRPETEDTYIEVTYNSNVLGSPVGGEYSQAGYAAAGYAIVGNINPSLTITT